MSSTNTNLGQNTLSNNSGINNTSIGANVLNNNTNASNNTGVGAYALLENTLYAYAHNHSLYTYSE